MIKQSQIVMYYLSFFFNLIFFNTGLTVKEFDDIYKKEIVKRYGKHEIKRLSNRKDSREQSIGAGRPFQVRRKKQVSDASWCITVFTLPTRWLAFCLTWTRATSAGTFKRLNR